jgi:lysophospholipase L1-like esterase
MYKKSMLYSIMAIASISLIFIISGFFNAMKFTIGSQNEIQRETDTILSQKEKSTQDKSTPLKNKNTIQILILGDSIAKGTGDEKVKGIAGYLPELFKNLTPKDTLVDNAGIDGYKIADLDAQFKSGKLDNSIKNADYIVLSIGGNDLREIQSIKDMLKEDAFRQKQDTYLTLLKGITKKIRYNNKNAVMIFVGLYNPYGADNSIENIRYVSNWNYNTQLIFSEDDKSVFVPTYDLFKFNLSRFISNDNLHPNSAGYQAISYTISKSIENILIGH